MTHRDDSWADRKLDAILPWFLLLFIGILVAGLLLLCAAGIWVVVVSA